MNNIYMHFTHTYTQIHIQMSSRSKNQQTKGSFSSLSVCSCSIGFVVSCFYTYITALKHISLCGQKMLECYRFFAQNTATNYVALQTCIKFLAFDISLVKFGSNAKFATLRHSLLCFGQKTDKFLEFFDHITNHFCVKINRI